MQECILAVTKCTDVAGAMGLRTEHQQDAKAQLIVEITRTERATPAEGCASELLDAAGGEASGLVMADDSTSNQDVLEHVRLVDGAGERPGIRVSSRLLSCLIAASQGTLLQDAASSAFGSIESMGGMSTGLH